MSEEKNSNDIDSFKLMNELIDQNPSLSEAEILDLFQQKATNINKPIELITNSIADKTNLLIESLTATQKPLDPSSSAQYEIDSLISSGGQSDVYLAHRSDGAYQKTVAIKVLKNRYTDPSERHAFLKETQILADLQHPNIVHIIDAGFNKNDEPWMVLNHIEGLHIDQFIEQYQPQVSQIIQLLIDVAKALSYIHQQGIYHLDIKPANIMVKIFADGPQAILIDFGISIKQNIETGDNENKKPQLATVGFASPEQLKYDSPASLDHRSDVYSFGKLMKYLINEYAPIYIVNPDLNSIALKATQLNPDDRYQKIHQLQTDLKRFRQDKSVSTRPLNVFQKLAKILTKKPLISGFFVVFLLVISVLVFTNWVQQQEQKQQTVQALSLNQKYWSQADEIKNTSRILYLRPQQNIQHELNKLNHSFEELFSQYQNESDQQKSSIAAAVAEAGISLGRYFEAQEALLFAISASPKENKIITQLAQNHLNIYQQELHKNKQYSDKKIREEQAAFLYQRHVSTAERLIEKLPIEMASQDIIAQSMVMYFNGNIDAAIDKLQEKDMDELWPIPRLFQASQYMAEEGRKLKIANSKQEALFWYRKAYETINQASDVARSHPDVLEKQCLIETEVLVLSLNFDNQNSKRIGACDELLILLPEKQSALIKVSEAYINLALAKFNSGKDPLIELSVATDLIVQLNRFSDMNAMANLLLGRIHFIKAEWNISSQQDGLPEFRQSIKHHEIAGQLLPDDYLIQNEYANALYKYGNSIRPFDEIADASFQKAVNILMQLLNHADATISLSSNIVKIMADHAYYRYQNSLDAEQQLSDADKFVSNMKKQWPDSISVSYAQSQLQWTYADYLVFQGKNPEPHLTQALKAFGQVIQDQPQRWTFRYNQISAMLSGVTYYLTNNQDQSRQLKAIENNLKQLSQIITNEVDLSGHYGYYHNMMAMNNIINNLDPNPHFKASRQYNNQCMKSPFDRYTCLNQFATLITVQALWNEIQNSFNIKQLQNDLSHIDKGLIEFPEHHQLMAQRAKLRFLMVKSNQLNPAEVKQQLNAAQEELNTVLSKQPLLSGRYESTLDLIKTRIQSRR